MLPLFGLHLTYVEDKNPVFRKIAKKCFEKQFLLPEYNFVSATMCLGFHKFQNIRDSKHCLELIFSFKDTKFKVDHGLSHSSLRRYIRFGQVHLNHIGKIRLSAVRIVYGIFRLN